MRDAFLGGITDDPNVDIHFFHKQVNE
jgi:hypothetical protein